MDVAAQQSGDAEEDCRMRAHQRHSAALRPTTRHDARRRSACLSQTLRRPHARAMPGTTSHAPLTGTPPQS